MPVTRKSKDAPDAPETPAPDFIEVELTKLDRLYAAGRLWLKNTCYKVEAEVAKDLLKLEDAGLPFFARFRPKDGPVETETVVREAEPVDTRTMVDVVDGKMEVGTKEEEAELGLPPLEGTDDVVKL